MTDIKFTETDVPTIVQAGRKAEPNPFDGLVDVLAQNVRTKDDAGKALTFTAPKHGENDESAVNYALRKIRQSAERHDVTVRSTSEGAKVTVWAVPKITRKRASKGADAS